MPRLGPRSNRTLEFESEFDRETGVARIIEGAENTDADGISAEASHTPGVCATICRLSSTGLISQSSSEPARTHPWSPLPFSLTRLVSGRA